MGGVKLSFKKIVRSGLILMVLASAGEALSQTPNLKLALNWKPEPQFGGFYSILAEGFDKKLGLQLELLEGGSGTPTLQLLSNRKVDAAIVSADEIAIAHDRGNKDIVALFAVYQDNPQTLIYRAKGKEKPQSLASLLQDPKVILSWQSGLPYALYLKKKYSIQAKEVPHPGGISVFLSNPLVLSQGFLTSEPLLLSQQKPPVQVHLYPISKEGFNPYTTVLAVHRSSIEKDPDLAQKWVSLARMGWKRYLQNPQSSHAWMQKLNPALEPAFLAASDTAQKNLIETKETQLKGLGVMSEARWSQLIEQLRSVGLIKKDLRARDLFTAVQTQP